MLDQLPVFFLITDHDRSRVDFNDLAFNPKVLDRDVIAVSQLRHNSSINENPVMAFRRWRGFRSNGRSNRLGAEAHGSDNVAYRSNYFRGLWG